LTKASNFELLARKGLFSSELPATDLYQRPTDPGDENAGAVMHLISNDGDY
jgi:hypothetical protein